MASNSIVRKPFETEISFTQATIRNIIGKRYKLRRILGSNTDIPIGTVFYCSHGRIDEYGTIFAHLSAKDRRHYTTEYGEVFTKEWASDWFDVRDFEKYFGISS